MTNFANQSASVRITSMEHYAQQTARNDTKAVTNVQAISPEILNSMTAQGMANQSGWSPGVPIDPMQPIGSEPRQWEYMIGQNIVQRPRSTEAVSFETIRAIIEMYDIAQMCIEVRQDELRNLEWDIVPVDEKDADKYESECKAARKFLEKPDGFTLFDDLQNQLAYDWLAFDALTIYPHLSKGGKLGALECVDGTTITPLVDEYGRIPLAPAPAYVQYAYGMPWVWLNRDQLIYKPHRRRTNKLYGFTPVEWLLNNINTDIRYQLYFLQYFTDGSIPDTWIQAPQEMQDPKQIKQFQDMYDAVMIGNQAQKHRAKFIPFGSKVQQAKDTKFDINFPHFMLTKSCAAWKVQPAEIGITEKVNKSSGETQEAVQYRRSIKPSATFMGSIWTGVVQKYFSPAIRFKYFGIDEQEDMLTAAQIDEIYIRNGVVSPDEVRIQRKGMEVDATNPVPRVFVISKQVMTVQDALKQSAAAVQSIEAQTDQARASAGEQPLPHNDNQNTNEDTTRQLEEDIEAEKAAKDFFISQRGRRRSLEIQKPKSG